MKLVCFANNTAGGLICDLLNNKISEFDGYRIDNIEHSLLKVGDTPTIQTQISINRWNYKVSALKDQTGWLGTHAHPNAIPDLSIFEDVIVITTLTRKSKLYRWLRCYHGWYKAAFPNWVEDDSPASIDKIRELAKNVFEEFKPYPNCKNIEFEDIVEGKFIKDNNLNWDYYSTWKKNNSYLYDNAENPWAIKRFDEAEYELTTGIPFKYI